jgi:hypothetical protein
VIPTLLLAGLLVGRCWMLAVAAVVWPALLLVRGIDLGLGPVVVASALAVINTAVGVAVHRAVRAMIR